MLRFRLVLALALSICIVSSFAFAGGRVIHYKGNAVRLTAQDHERSRQMMERLNRKAFERVKHFERQVPWLTKKPQIRSNGLMVCPLKAGEYRILRRMNKHGGVDFYNYAIDENQ